MFRYLAISLNRPEEAREALMLLRGGDTDLVDNEMKEMQAEREAEMEEPHISVINLLRSAKLRVSLMVCIVLHLSQQFCGIRYILVLVIFPHNH